jgi:hypothetical protein
MLGCAANSGGYIPEKELAEVLGQGNKQDASTDRGVAQS